jgi:hypothetical protein
MTNTNVNPNAPSNRTMSGSNGTDSRAGMARANAAHSAGSANNRSRHARSNGAASARDNMADQLNGQSLQAANQGRPYSPGGAGMGGSNAAGGMSAPTHSAGGATPGGGSK